MQIQYPSFIAFPHNLRPRQLSLLSLGESSPTLHTECRFSNYYQYYLFHFFRAKDFTALPGGVGGYTYYDRNKIDSPVRLQKDQSH